MTRKPYSLKPRIRSAVSAGVLVGTMPALMACSAEPFVERLAEEVVERVIGRDYFDRVIEGPGYRLRIERDGTYELAPDGSGVVALSDGGYLDIRMRRNGTEVRIRFDDRDGRIDRAFWLDDETRPWGGEAEQFVGEVMPILFRETFTDVTERVAWLLENGGDTALLNEINLIRSDGSQRRYTEAYAASGTIPNQPLVDLMALANQIGSDSQLRRTLVSVYGIQRPTGDPLVALIEAGETIGSDSQARRFLAAIGRSLPDTEEAVSAYLTVAGTIGSDSQMRRALVETVVRDDLSDAHVGQIIGLAGRSIGSDSQLRRLLEEAAPRVGDSESLVRAYMSAVRSIGSDSQERRALRALAARTRLTSSSLQVLLDSAGSISIDAELRPPRPPRPPRSPRPPRPPRPPRW